MAISMAKYYVKDLKMEMEKYQDYVPPLIFKRSYCLRKIEEITMYSSVIQVRTDQGLVVKIRCPMRS